MGNHHSLFCEILSSLSITIAECSDLVVYGSHDDMKYLPVATIDHFLVNSHCKFC